MTPDAPTEAMAAYVVVDATDFIVNAQLLTELEAAELCATRTRFPVNHHPPFRALRAAVPSPDSARKDT